MLCQSATRWQRLFNQLRAATSQLEMSKVYVADLMIFRRNVMTLSVFSTCPVTRPRTRRALKACLSLGLCLADGLMPSDTSCG